MYQMPCTQRFCWSGFILVERRTSIRRSSQRSNKANNVSERRLMIRVRRQAFRQVVSYWSGCGSYVIEGFEVDARRWWRHLEQVRFVKYTHPLKTAKIYSNKHRPNALVNLTVVSFQITCASLSFVVQRNKICTTPQNRWIVFLNMLNIRNSLSHFLFTLVVSQVNIWT